MALKKRLSYLSVLAWLTVAVCTTALGGDLLSQIDLSRPPDYQRIAAATNPVRLSAFRDALGDTLIESWKPGQSGRLGSSGQAAFAEWVDLYRWIDLLESSESAVFQKWFSPHLHVEVQKDQTPRYRVGIIPPGAPLSHEEMPSELFEYLAHDSSFKARIMGEFVSQPFAPQNGLLIDRLDPEFVSATISDPEFQKLWSENFSEDNFAPKVLLNLQAIWKGNRADWHEFLPLAMAIAVVKDEQPPAFWPHSQVAPENVPRCDTPPQVLFSQWVRAFRAGKLRLDPRQLEVGDLKFVVDAPLDPSEFDWVRGNTALAHQDPARAFESITYDQGRVIKEVYVWPWGKYLLAQIRKHGGICVDQAYYAAISGKALGIPTIFFSGLGKDGGHAWVGYLKSPGHWDLSVARYAGENYATGEALDPQSWKPITDHDLELLTQHLGNSDFIHAAIRDLVIASDFRRKGDVQGEGRALGSALRVCPENPAIWDAKEAWLLRSGASLADLKAHHEAAMAQFTRFNDLKTAHEQALVQLALQSGDQRKATQLSERIVHENQGGWNHDARTDLSASAAWTLISERIQAGNGDGAVAEYERQLRLQGARGGGDFYYKVVAPFASELMSFGRKDLSLRILKEANQTLKPTRDSLVDRDLRKLWKEAGGNL